MVKHLFGILWLAFVLTLVGCANISSPTGGKKDIIPPKLVSVEPADSMTNTRVSELTMYFDEYITVGDVAKNLQVQPLLTIPPTLTGSGKHATFRLIDSLLEDNTTYRISFGGAIKDLHEGNPFTGYTYTFSTGSYFDSLKITGNVLNAATGLPDTSGIVVVLHAGTENDTAIIRKKPKYITTPDSKGHFVFKGLPGRSFRIYAIRDENDNMIYDGGTEMIAFSDSLIYPSDTVAKPITMRVFMEVPDSTEAADTTKSPKRSLRRKNDIVKIPDSNLVWSTNIDTSNISRRTFDVTDSIKLVFNKTPTIDPGKIELLLQNGKTSERQQVKVHTDTANRNIVYVVAGFADNKIYTLKIDSAFAVDTANVASVVVNYKFRTLYQKDYGKIKLNIPSKYLSPDEQNSDMPDYVLVMKAGDDTLYQRKITDTIVSFDKLLPAKYTFRIIVDNNRNGVWNTGNVLENLQPEVVIPCMEPIVLKADWEHTVDFEKMKKAIMVGDSNSNIKSKRKN